MITDAENAVRAGDLPLALDRLQDAIRAKPEDVRLRVFLFQLLCVLGRWERALSQLEVCAEMDAAAIAMRETYRDAIAFAWELLTTAQPLQHAEVGGHADVDLLHGEEGVGRAHAQVAGRLVIFGQPARFVANQDEARRGIGRAAIRDGVTQGCRNQLPGTAACSSG